MMIIFVLKYTFYGVLFGLSDFYITIRHPYIFYTFPYPSTFRLSCRPDCLVVCRHPDVVSGVCFHPINDRFFLTGCLDKKLRVWDLESGTPVVSAWAQVGVLCSVVCCPYGLTIYICFR